MVLNMTLVVKIEVSIYWASVLFIISNVTNAQPQNIPHLIYKIIFKQIMSSLRN